MNIFYALGIVLGLILLMTVGYFISKKKFKKKGKKQDPLEIYPLW